MGNTHICAGAHTDTETMRHPLQSMHCSTYIHYMAMRCKKQVLYASFFPGRLKRETFRAYVYICVCVCVYICVCARVSCLSGSECIARCLLTYWGFVVVVGGLLAVQTTEKELSPFFLCFYLLVSVFVCVSENNMNIDSILCCSQTDKHFVTRWGGFGFRCSATWVHQGAYPCSVQSACLC